jgi:LacI family transcriptional regulator
VVIGHGCLDEPFNRIVPDYQHDLRIIFDRLLELRYRRIGLHQTPYQMMITEGNQYAAYRFLQDRLPPNEHLPVFNEISMKAEHANQIERLVDWLRKERVEVLLLNHVRLANELRSAGLRIPEDLGVVHLGHGESPGSPLSGIQYPVDHYGKAAIDLLSGELMRNERGLPPFPLKTAIAGDWRAGQTLRRPADSIHSDPAPTAPRATMPSLQWYMREFQTT